MRESIEGPRARRPGELNEHPLEYLRRGEPDRRKHKWPIDWSCLDKGKNGFKKIKGIPSPQDPRRCQSARIRIRPYVQCPAWAQKGTIACRIHGRGSHKRRSKEFIHKVAWYTGKAGEALDQAVRKMAGTPDDRMSLAEEIDIARVAALEAAKAFSMISLSDEMVDGKPKFSLALKTATTDMMLDRINTVAELVAKHSKIRMLSESVVDIEQLDYITSQVSMILNHRLANVVEKEYIDLIAQDMRQIKLPERKKTIQNAQNAQMLLDAAKEIQEQNEPSSTAS